MALPKEIQNRGNRLLIGLTDIHIDHKKQTVTIEHRGNMGNNIRSVEENVDLCYSKGAFKRLEKLCKSIKEHGSPDYYYERVMKF